MPRLVPLIVTLLLSSSACIPDFKPASQLDETPQVLAVRAEPPEVMPGGLVELDALVHFPGGAADYLWLVCIPGPADTIDTCVSNRLAGGGVLLPLCSSAPGASLCYASREATATYRVPTDLPLDEAGRATIFIELVVGDDVDSDECVRAYRDLEPPARCLVALKRLTVSAAPDNTNPELAGINVDGMPVTGTVKTVDPTGAQGEELAVRLTVAADDESLDEIIWWGGTEDVDFPVAWYSDCGKFDDDRSSVRCEWYPHAGGTGTHCWPTTVTWKPRASGECTVHVVLRDGRGGVDWLTQRFLVGSARYQ